MSLANIQVIRLSGCGKCRARAGRPCVLVPGEVHVDVHDWRRDAAEKLAAYVREEVARLAPADVLRYLTRVERERENERRRNGL